MEAWLLLHLSALVLGVGIVAVAVALAVVGLLAVRRSVALSTLESHHDVAGFILAVIGVVYAVLLAFVVISVWEQFEDAKSHASQEAALVGNLYRDTLRFPDGGGRARQALRRYARSVVDQEWNEMSEHRRESQETDLALNRVWRTYADLRPRTAAQEAFYGEAVSSLHDATELRRERILSSGSELPSPLWLVLIAGALISIGFTYFFGVANLSAQVLMVVALASIVALVLFLVLSLDLPFTGDIGVGPSAMRNVIGEFRHYGA